MYFRRLCTIKYDRTVDSLNFLSNIKRNDCEIQVFPFGDNELLMICDIKIDLPRHKTIIKLTDLEIHNEKCERAMESIAEFIAVCSNSGFELRSIIPIFLLKPSCNKQAILIKKLNKQINKTEFSMHFENLLHYQTIEYKSLDILEDRLTGVNSLAESLSTKTPVSKYKELCRFFENAFRLDFFTKCMVRPLSLFLDNFGLGYTSGEVHKWCELRGGFMHGDTKKSDFFYERDIAKLVPRMSQAALLTLNNKKTWQSPDPEIRSNWKPSFCVIGENSDSAQIFVGTQMKQQIGTIRDIFGSWKMRNDSKAVNPQLYENWIPMGVNVSWAANFKAVEPF